MKILTLWQPWASLIAIRLKSCETRAWQTDYRGLIAIHAAKRKPDKAGWLTWLDSLQLSEISEAPLFDHLPLGAIVAVAELKDCRIMGNPHPQLMYPDRVAFISEQTPLELATGNWHPGRYAWEFANVLALPNPIECRGYQGLRDLDPVIVDLIERRNGFSGGQP